MSSPSLSSTEVVSTDLESPSEVTSDSDIDTLCQELKSHLWTIASDDQRRLLAPESAKIKQSRVENVLRDLTDELEHVRGITKVEKWGGKVDKVVKSLYPVIDTAVQSGGPFGPLVWASVRVILQVKFPHQFLPTLQRSYTTRI